MRVGFVLLAMLGGVGIAVYLACWLIIPAAADRPADGDGRPGSGVVEVAQACAACVALAALALLATVATLFGFGWVIVILAVGVLAAVLAYRRRLGPGWALLPIAALTLPAVAVAASGLRLDTRTGDETIAPQSAAQLRSSVYRSGLGTMLIDLRRTSLPAGGVVPLTIDAGVRRTIVALPAAPCVRVDVHYDVNPFVVRMGALLTGRANPPFSGVDVFGRLYTTRTGDVTNGAGGPYPVLKIDFSSQGGSLYVRDYPVTVDPGAQPDWPGYAVTPEPYPNLKYEPRRLRPAILRAWHRRRLADVRSQRTIEALMPGPCG